MSMHFWMDSSGPVEGIRPLDVCLLHLDLSWRHEMPSEAQHYFSLALRIGGKMRQHIS